jgi:hypothetical protein
MESFEIPAPILAILDIKSVEDPLYLSAMSVRSNWRGSIQSEKNEPSKLIGDGKIFASYQG